MKQKRAERITEALKETGLTQMLIVNPMSIYYLTGVYMEPFERFYAPYLGEDENRVYFLNKLLIVPEDMGVKKAWYLGTDPAVEIATGYLDKENPLGVDRDLKARFLLSLMEMGTAVGFVSPSIAVDRIRGAKDEEEQDKVHAVSGIDDRAMAGFKELVREGVMERQVANRMLKIYMDLGTDGFSFKPLVAFGANAADPHHGSDGTVMKPGDPVLFDAGCIKDGYCPDAARAFYFQKASDGHHRTYEIVRSVNETTILKVRPGAPLYGLDGVARDLITEQRYRPLFTHRLGHSIGLGEHGSGSVSSVNTRKAEPGVIFSIGPRTHLSGNTGVRVEDLVLVTKEGCEAFNHYSKEFEIVG